MLYFAYGSNLHPERLRRRVPSREMVAVATLDDHEITFTKRGMDGSGKCGVVPSTAPQAIVYGVLYRIAPAERPILDLAEGVHSGGYQAIDITVTLEHGAPEQAFTYMPPSRFMDPQLQPFHWYKAFVVHGAHYHALPSAWIAQLEAVSAIADPDEERATHNAGILASLT